MPANPPQTCSAVLMIRPVGFHANRETAATNPFQNVDLHGDRVAAAAEREFDRLADALRGAGIAVAQVAGRAVPETPDQLFPNNWLSLHADGAAVLYPMAAQNRRLERRPELLRELTATHGFAPVRRVVDLSGYEAAGRFLEGTGSLVFDHRARLAYACLSPRTDLSVAADLCLRLGYALQPFVATDPQGRAIYHTNVVMSVGERFAVLCAAAIRNTAQRTRILRELQASGRDVIEISLAQMAAFAANLLQLRGAGGRAHIALSATAFDAFEPEQLRRLAQHGELLPVPIPTIEAAGGGSVRCMVAEIFLPGTENK